MILTVRSPEPRPAPRERLAIIKPPGVPQSKPVEAVPSARHSEPPDELLEDESDRSTPLPLDEDRPSQPQPAAPSSLGLSPGYPLKFGFGLLLLVVSLLAVLIPEEAATLNIRFQVQLVAALTAVASLLAASIIGYIRGGWRSASEDALVFVGALATFSAGFIEWLIWVRGGVSASIAMGALISTTGVAAFTWAGRWLEASLQQRLLRRLEPLRELSGPELRELGPQLWGDGRSENTATRSWAEQAGAEPLGVHPRPETSELLRQTAAIRGDGASPTGRDAIRWATILLLLALPLAVALLMALLYWERNTTASLLLAAATVLALNPRALRRAWVGPVLAAAGRAAGQGVFFRDGAALEATARSHWVVFDALGTLTRGEPLVTAVVGVGSLSEDEILALVAGVEKAAGADSVGDAIIEEAHARGVSPVQVRLARRIPGMGVSATSPRGDLLVGTRQLLLGQGISVAEADQGAAEMETNAETVLFVALAGRIQGVMALRDERRPGAKSVASALNELGVEPVLMTGDSRLTADALGMELGFEHIRAEVAPEQWAAQVTSLRETGHGIAMVVRPPRHEETLAAADVGMTLGGAGLELDAAGVALEGDNPGQAVMTVGIARSAFRASRINLFVASALVIVELGLSSLALSSMSQGHHGWTLPIIVPVIVALASSFSAALLSWEMMSGSRAVRF